jgi:hypothetical protein
MKVLFELLQMISKKLFGSGKNLMANKLSISNLWQRGSAAITNPFWSARSLGIEIKQHCAGRGPAAPAGYS